jgi:hypothetical protein
MAEHLYPLLYWLWYSLLLPFVVVRACGCLRGLDFGIGFAHLMVFSQIFRCVSTNFVTWVTDIPALLGHDADVQRESAAI